MGHQVWFPPTVKPGASGPAAAAKPPPPPPPTVEPWASGPAAAAKPPPPPPPTVEPRASGPAAAVEPWASGPAAAAHPELQHMLSSLGFDIGTPHRLSARWTRIPLDREKNDLRFLKFRDSVFDGLQVDVPDKDYIICLHGTTSAGLGGILRDRRIKPGPACDGWGDVVCCLGFIAKGDTKKDDLKHNQDELVVTANNFIVREGKHMARALVECRMFVPRATCKKVEKWQSMRKEGHPVERYAAFFPQDHRNRAYTVPSSLAIPIALLQDDTWDQHLPKMEEIG